MRCADCHCTMTATPGVDGASSHTCKGCGRVGHLLAQAIGRADYEPHRPVEINPAIVRTPGQNWSKPKAPPLTLAEVELHGVPGFPAPRVAEPVNTGRIARPKKTAVERAEAKNLHPMSLPKDDPDYLAWRERHRAGCVEHHISEAQKKADRLNRLRVARALLEDGAPRNVS